MLKFLNNNKKNKKKKQRNKKGRKMIHQVNQIVLFLSIKTSKKM